MVCALCIQYIFVDQQFDDYLPSPTPRNGFFQVVSGDPRKGSWGMLDFLIWGGGSYLGSCFLNRYMISRLVRVGETDFDTCDFTNQVIFSLVFCLDVQAFSRFQI